MGEDGSFPGLSMLMMYQKLHPPWESCDPPSQQTPALLLHLDSSKVTATECLNAQGQLKFWHSGRQVSQCKLAMVAALPWVPQGKHAPPVPHHRDKAEAILSTAIIAPRTTHSFCKHSTLPLVKL
jgi:hypothetical protein